MDQPLPSSLLPKGWQNMPETVLRDVTLRLPYADAEVHCQSFERMSFICDNEFWKQKAKLDFVQDLFEVSYENPYFNYLASRVRYLQASIRKLLPDLIPDFEQYLANQKRELGRDYTTSVDKFISTAPHFGDVSIFDQIQQEKVKRGELRYFESGQYDNDARVKIIKAYFDEKKSIIREIRSRESEATQLSMILAKHLDETQPHSFRLVILPVFLKGNPSFIKNHPLNEEEKQALVDYFLSLGIKPDDLILYGKRIFFFTSFFDKDKYQLDYRDRITSVSLEGYPLSVGPQLFINFCTSLGLSVNAIRWLYNLSIKALIDLRRKELGMDEESMKEMGLLSEVMVTRWNFSEVNSRLRAFKYPERTLETIDLTPPKWRMDKTVEEIVEEVKNINLREATLRSKR